MDNLVKILIEEEKRLSAQEQVVETAFRHPAIDVEQLKRNGYISAEEYHEGRKSRTLTEDQLKEAVRRAAEAALGNHDSDADCVEPGHEETLPGSFSGFQFLFFAYRREGNPIHLLFRLDGFKIGKDGNPVLLGEVTFGNEVLPGTLHLVFRNDGEGLLKEISFRHKGNGKKYLLEPDVRSSSEWAELVRRLIIE